jgi:hypothetical protein
MSLSLVLLCLLSLCQNNPGISMLSVNILSSIMLSVILLTVNNFIVIMLRVQNHSDIVVTDILLKAIICVIMFIFILPTVIMLIVTLLSARCAVSLCHNTLNFT